MVVEHSRSMIQALKFICSVIVAMMAEEEGKKNPDANTTKQNEPGELGKLSSQELGRKVPFGNPKVPHG